MKLIKYEQGSAEWLLWRASKITATDASCILGINPFKSALDCWNEKLGITPPIEVNKAMQRGYQLEPLARQIAMDLLITAFEPCVVESDQHYWQAASLDGISNSGKIVLEIKCPGAGTHEYALSIGIPKYYECQMQHQFSVTGAEKGYYMSYRPEHAQPIKIIEIFPNEKYIENLVEKEKDFYENYLCVMKPPIPWALEKRKSVR